VNTGRAVGRQDGKWNVIYVRSGDQTVSMGGEIEQNNWGTPPKEKRTLQDVAKGRTQRHEQF